MKTKDKIESQYRIPCGPMDIAADAVCRRTLKDSMDKLLDRLTLEVNPQVPTSKLGKDVEVNEEGHIVKTAEESPEDKKQRLIEEGKFRADVQAEIKKYKEETLQGNSKMLQDISGKYESI